MSDSLKLTKILMSLNIDDESGLDDYKYVGGNRNHHLNYFNLVYKNERELPAHSQFCRCGHKITENCYIADKQDNIYVIGNCCIKKFMKHSKRSCEKCQKPHKNRRDNFCNSCRAENEEESFPTITYENHCEECGEMCGKFKKCLECFHHIFHMVQDP